MDYALGFSRDIVKQALNDVAEEVLNAERRTGWIRYPYKISAKNVPPEYLHKTQAQFFADNFAATVVQVLGYLLFREPSLDRMRNIEFRDAGERLRDAQGTLVREKVEKIIGLEGPFRSHRSTQLILKTIYLY
jgi:hypothetical protein